MIGKPRGHNGAIPVYVYSPTYQRKMYVGSRPTLAEAQELEAAAKANASRRVADGEPVRSTAAWSVESKGDVFCRHCDKPAQHLHHIVPRATGMSSDRLENGLPLCKRCHQGWHNRVVVIPAEKLRHGELLHAIELIGTEWVTMNYPGTIHVESIDAALREELRTLRAEHDKLLAEAKRWRSWFDRAPGIASNNTSAPCAPCAISPVGSSSPVPTINAMGEIA